jgi:hypothetical protein
VNVKRHLLVVAAIGSLLGGRDALASDPQTQLNAEKLFREGRAALASGDLIVACSKFEESQKLDASAGTVLNLADCYERSGKHASALLAYREAARQAGLRGRKDWLDTASARAAALEKIVPTMVIRVVAAASSSGDVEVTRDDVKVDPSTYNTNIPVDAGEHVIRATAPGKEAWTTTVKMMKGAREVIEVPALKSSSSSSSPTPTPTPTPTTPTPIVINEADGSSQRTIGLIGIGVGVAGLLAGGLTGALASSSLDDAKADCPSYPDRCRPAGDEANGRAETFALVSTISFIAGGVILVGGTVLFLTAKKAPKHRGAILTPLRVTF